MRKKSDLSVIAQVCLNTVSEQIADSSGENRSARSDGRLQQRSAEWQHCASVRAGAFGEKDDRNTGRQSVRNFAGWLIDAVCAAALNEDRASAAGQHSKDRPQEYLGLRDKDARHHRCVEQDIQITQMVRNNKAIGR